MAYKVLKSDWKIFLARLEAWRERYLAKTNPKIVAILADKSKTPTEQFWDAKREIDSQIKILRRCLDEFTKARMIWHLVDMHYYGMIDNDDLLEFSDGLREEVIVLVNRD